MVSKAPEEIEALKAANAAKNAEKAAKKAAKKEKFGSQNSNQNMPVVDVVVPWTNTWRDPDSRLFYTKEIDIEKYPWKGLIEEAEENYRREIARKSGIRPEYSVRVRVKRSDSEQENTYRRLYGNGIEFIQR